MNSLTPYLVKNNIALLLLTLICLACKRPRTTVESVETPPAKIIQGVKGKVLFKEGEFSTSGTLRNGRVYGIERKILFYELTSLKDVEIAEGDFIKYTSTEMMDSITSDKYGNFSKSLPEGEYSIFVKEANRLYSKLGDEDYYYPVTVVKDSCVNIIIEVDYRAVYKSGQ
jgi:hypothetical protein